MKQVNLTEFLPLGSKEKRKTSAQFQPRLIHGGQDAKGKRKNSRPFTTKSSMHLILKSNRAKGAWSLRHRKNQSRITSMVYVYAARFRVHVYRFANAGDSLHLLVKANERKDLADFLRVLAGRVAITVSGARKHVKRIGKFWNYLCWSKLVKWGKEFHQVQRHVFVHELETSAKKLINGLVKNPYLLPDSS